MKRIMFLGLLAAWCGALWGQIGPDVSVDQYGQQLKWEVGSRDYFVLFKSVLANNDNTNDNEPNGYNPQADACIADQSQAQFLLSEEQLPDDAWVEKAYLVWMSHADANPAATVDRVTLHFSGAHGQPPFLQEVVSTVTGPAQPTKSFEYEFIKDTLTSSSIYTYRVDVTDIVQQIQFDGRDQGISPDGETLYGSWSVSGIECFTSDTLISKKSLIGAWALVLIYNSEKIRPKKIYLYNGMLGYFHAAGNLTVQGFELPTDAEIRLSLIMAEGDPGLFVGPPVYQSTEALNLSGSANSDWLPLFNACNPPRTNYVEIYNSISSVYGWTATDPICIGGDPEVLDPLALEYGIDVDTFIVKAAEPPFDGHLHFGDTSFKLAVHADQDMVFSNLLVVSVESKAPQFDIPANPQTPDGREKWACSCSQQHDAFCLTQSFYYLIKIQNWGDNSALQVSLYDDLPDMVDYVPGTTEIATIFDENGNGTDWRAVEDAGGFPFASSTTVAELMEPCDSGTMTCASTVMVRFKVSPKEGLPKNTVISNRAEIQDVSGVVYRTNSDVPLRLKADQGCPAACEPTRELCGGICSDPSCGDDPVTDNGGLPDDGVPADTDPGADTSVSGDEQNATDADQIEEIFEEGSGCGCTLTD